MTMEIPKLSRRFIANDINLQKFEDIQPYFETLLSKELSSISIYTDWLKDVSELEAFLEENMAWRYIKMTIDTTNETHNASYSQFIKEIQPRISEYSDLLNKKIFSTSYHEDLISNSKEEGYDIFFKTIRIQLDLFREANISIESYINEKSQEYGAISAAQVIIHDNETLTMQKAMLWLKKQNENDRKLMYDKIVDRRKLDTSSLNDLFTDLIQKRHELSMNAGFENFRDYKFKSMGRFDYTKENCFEFHESIAQLVVPLVKEIQNKKLNKLGKTKFKPWDLDVDPNGFEPLKPFNGGKEMLDNTIRVFNKLDPFFGDCLRTMEKMNHLDLESKPGKAPGGYNYPLYEIGVPFIFMNAVGSQRDLVTMVHEGGHAVHSFLNRGLILTGFKNIPSEAAELASMSMELLTMKHWNEFYPNSKDEKRAKKEHLEDILKVLPWIAQIDAFQHWIYLNPSHNLEDRNEQWLSLCQRFGTGLTDWTGYEDQLMNSWQRQLHLFEVPFYYIEYGIAQLGALGIWKNSLQDEPKTIKQYKEGLSLGYTKSLPMIYESAGVPFDFTQNHLKELISFVKKELSLLESN